MMGFTVERALRQLDAATRDDARAAIEWLLPEGEDWADLQQIILQGFLWYSLPMKWLTETSHHHEVAWALGDLFEVGGLARYAELCRSTATHELISQWADDEDGARRRFRTLMLDSGVDPPDTTLLTWGSIQGMTEHIANLNVSAALEAALDDGSLHPERRGWRSVATSVAERTLLGPDPSGEHPSVLAAIEAERIRNWIRDIRDRTSLTDDAATALAADLASAADDEDFRSVGASLEPLTWFLGRVGGGLTLTEAGYLPRALALEADERYDWFDLKPRFTVRGERDLPELMFVHGLARETRLVTLRRRRLTVSARGREALDDAPSLVRAVLGQLFDPTTWGGDSALGMALALIGADPAEPLTRTELDTALHRYLRTRWQRGTSQLEADDVLGAGRQLLTAGRAFGWSAREERGMWRLAPRLTDVGRRACLLGLRAAALAPRA